MFKDSTYSSFEVNQTNERVLNFCFKYDISLTKKDKLIIPYELVHAFVNYDVLDKTRLHIKRKREFASGVKMSNNGVYFESISLILANFKNIALIEHRRSFFNK